jgi:chromosome segregation ATPase
MRKQLLTKLLSAAFLTAFVCVGNAFSADDFSDKAEYKRDMQKRIDKLQAKINEVKNEQKEEHAQAQRKIQEYEDKINSIKRDTEAKIDNVNDRNKINDRMSSVSRNFHEWRFENAMRSYENKISNLKSKIEAEDDAKDKLALEEELKKTETKRDMVKAKLNDLRTTDGANWSKIEDKMENTLREIDRDFDEAKSKVD